MEQVEEGYFCDSTVLDECASEVFGSDFESDREED
jgi:hypothetical protein